MKDLFSEIKEHLTALYGEDRAAEAFSGISAMINQFSCQPKISPWIEAAGFTEKDAVLITYPDQVTQAGALPIQTLRDFFSTNLKDLVSIIHLLPFYPSTSDDGFAVSDYRNVDPSLGTWEDVTCFRPDFRLMFDAVINHVSASHAWFTGFKNGAVDAMDFFITVEGSPDLSGVVRPRALPLLTDFKTKAGKKSVWTTFSADQVDLNYSNPAVLVEILETLLFYAERGCELFRLDAIAYLWKEIGTSCINLPQTHRIVQLLRLAVNQVYPTAMFITETNIPHNENLSYFGDGTNEANLVYNFALPPLVLHTIQTGCASRLTKWAKTLALPSNKVSFFNFLASHDGIGLNPVRGILDETEIQQMVACTSGGGGLVSYKDNPDGSRSVYELNINYFDALNGQSIEDPINVQVARFMASQAIMLSLAGVPGIYFHSLFGSRGWLEGVHTTGRNRSINRQKLVRSDLERELNTKGSIRQLIFERYCLLLQTRRKCTAFHPAAKQELLELDPGVFSLARSSLDGNQIILALQNVTGRLIELRIKESLPWVSSCQDLFTGSQIAFTETITLLSLAPYQTAWLEIK